MGKGESDSVIPFLGHFSNFDLNNGFLLILVNGLGSYIIFEFKTQKKLCCKTSVKSLFARFYSRRACFCDVLLLENL